MRRLRESRWADALRRQFRGPVREPRWEGVQTLEEASHALAYWAQQALQGGTGDQVVVIGDAGPLQQRTVARLQAQGHRFVSLTPGELPGWRSPAPARLAISLCALTDARRITETAAAISRHPQLAEVRFEYVSGLYPERSAFVELDEYRDTWFISPVLLEQPSPYDLYAESLVHFEQKCGLRDFLDLYQLLHNVVRSGMPGDIAEFGSYRGHSGYLIAKTLQALRSNKHLYMFDTFDAFPEEPLGVDQFWSSTHDVDFQSVRRKFAGLGGVSFVKGDFTRTLGETPLSALALAYIDCDSYRATRFLIDELVGDRLAPGGLLVFEDYGHPALLGNRAAVEECLRGAQGFRFFSQFSGLYVFMKPGQ